MAFAGLIFIGLLFGIILTAGVVGFVVVRSGGPMKESLFGGGAGKLAIGKPPAGPELSPEADKRHKALLEELRITQKLLDQGRGDREEHEKAVKASAAEMVAVRAQIADRDLRVQALEGSLREAMLRIDNLMTQLSDRTEEYATVSLQLKDTRMELEVTESGSSVTASQITQLQRERDELAALVDQLQPRRSASRPFA